MKFDTLYESLHILDKTTRNLGPDLVTDATLNSSVSSDNSKYYGRRGFGNKIAFITVKT